MKPRNNETRIKKMKYIYENEIEIRRTPTGFVLDIDSKDAGIREIPIICKDGKLPTKSELEDLLTDSDDSEPTVFFSAIEEKIKQKIADYLSKKSDRAVWLERLGAHTYMAVAKIGVEVRFTIRKI